MPVDLPSAAPAVSPAPASSAEVVRRWRLLAARLHKNPDLAAADVRALRRQINELSRLHRRWQRSAAVAVKVRGVTVIRTKARERWRARRPGQVRTGGGQNWAFDLRSRGRCPSCYAPLPHETFEKRKYHNLMVRVKVPGLKKSWAKIRAGLHRPWEASARVRVAKAQARRSAAFAAEVPHVAARLGPAKVAEIVAGYDSRYGYKQFRQWVRCHYGSGPRVFIPRPAHEYGCTRDPTTGQWRAPAVRKR